MNKRCVAYTYGFFLVMFWSRGAEATDAFDLSGYGPVSQAMGGTGVAYDIGPGGMMENPATLGLMDNGRHVGVGLDLIFPFLKAEDTATGEDVTSSLRNTNNGPYYAPQLSFVWRKDRYTIGIGAFGEGGVGTQFGNDSFLSRTATNNIDTGLDQFSRLLVMKIPLSAAYKVTDKLTVGGSIDAVWTSVNLGMLLDASQLGSLASEQRVSGSLVPTLLTVPGLSGGYLNFSNDSIAGGGASAWGIGGKVGLTYQIAPSTMLGVAYNFKTNVANLSGDAHLTAVSSVAGNIPSSGQVRLRDFQMPAKFTVGVSHRFTDKLTVAADYQRVFWSDAMKDIRVGFKQDGTGKTLNLDLPFNYRDINVFSIGAQYKYDDNWVFRAGFHYADQATPGDGLIAVIPATPTTNVTGGFSYIFDENDVFNFAIIYAFPESLKNKSQPETSVPLKTTHAQITAAIDFEKRF